MAGLSIGLRTDVAILYWDRILLQKLPRTHLQLHGAKPFLSEACTVHPHFAANLGLSSKRLPQNYLYQSIAICKASWCKLFPQDGP